MQEGYFGQCSYERASFVKMRELIRQAGRLKVSLIALLVCQLSCFFKINGKTITNTSLFLQLSRNVNWAI